MTPAEVRAAAVATGDLFAHFVGDGASVPWEYIPPPYKWVLWAYKNYLDLLAPAAFKLHDFLYAEISNFLPVTKEEADFTLFWELSQVSLLDAEVVYVAVRLGGARYYQRIVLVPRSGDNIGFAGNGGPMAIFKSTMLIQQTTNLGRQADPNINRVGGWSESFYQVNFSLTDALTYMITDPSPGIKGLCENRAALLGAGASVVGQRVQQVGVVGASISGKKVFPGNQSLEVDVPGMALLCDIIPPGATKARTFKISGIPDQFVVQGEFQPGPAYSRALDRYFANVRAYSLKARDTAVPQFDVSTISGVGLLTALVAIPFALGDFVQVVGTSNALLNKKSGVFKVIAVLPLTFQVTLEGWPFGACVGGKVKANSFTYPIMLGGVVSINRISLKKVGAPFVRFRGRRSKRQRTV